MGETEQVVHCHGEVQLIQSVLLKRLLREVVAELQVLETQE